MSERFELGLLIQRGAKAYGPWLMGRHTAESIADDILTVGYHRRTVDVEALRAEVTETLNAAGRYLGLAPGDFSAQVSRDCCGVFLGLIDKHTSERTSELLTHYLSRAEVAGWIGVRPATLGRYKLPPADATIGAVRGWLPDTIDRWNAARPGRGARTDLTRSGDSTLHPHDVK